MKAIVVSFYEAYPPSSGAASVTWNCARYAPSERVLLQMASAARREEAPEGVRVHTYGGASGRLRKLGALPRTVGAVVRQCRRFDPDVVFLEGASWTVYHLLLLRALRRAGLRALTIYHAHNVEYLLRREKHGPLITWLTRRAEGALFRRADLAFVVSEVDRRHVEELYGMRAEVLPNGVDAGHFADVPDEAVASVRAKYGLDEQTVLFMGFYAYRPNRQAVDRLVHSIFPRVVARHPAARLAVIGSDIPYRRPWLITPGRVAYKELAPVVAACGAGAAPIYSGSGTRLKILEYLAAGLPVVATPKGAEGLKLRHGEHLLMTEGDTEFADALVRLFTDAPLAARLAERGRAAVRAHYAWPAIMDRCWARIQQVLAEGNGEDGPWPIG